MSATLRILSKESDGTFESTIFPIPLISEFSIKVKETDPTSVDVQVVGEELKYDENVLNVKTTDGQETEFDANSADMLFEVKDDEGEMIVSTSNLFKLEEGFLIAQIESSFNRKKAMKPSDSAA